MEVCIWSLAPFLMRNSQSICSSSWCSVYQRPVSCLSPSLVRADPHANPLITKGQPSCLASWHLWIKALTHLNTLLNKMWTGDFISLGWITRGRESVFYQMFNWEASRPLNQSAFPSVTHRNFKLLHYCKKMCNAFIVCVYMHVCECHGTCVDIRGQFAAVSWKYIICFCFYKGLQEEILNFGLYNSAEVVNNQGAFEAGQ